MTIRKALLNCAATVLSPPGRRGRLLILIYHRVLPEPDPMRPDEVDAGKFEWQMKLMSESFKVMPLSEACRALDDGALPARAACITFDDGYADNADIAVPILKKLGLHATFFIATGFLNGGRMWNDTVIEAIRMANGSGLDLLDVGLGQWKIESMTQRSNAARNLIYKLRHLEFDTRLEKVKAVELRVGGRLPDTLMLTTEKLRYIADQGMEIGAHTVNHPILTRLDNERAVEEIVESKSHLERMTGIPVNLFAYPNGKPDTDYDQRHVTMVKDSGFNAAVSTHWGAARAGNDLYQLPRFSPWQNTPEQFYQALVRNYFR